MSKIKVLHIIKSLGRGGAEVLLEETLKLHDTDNFEFHYIYFLPWKNSMVEGLKRAGGKVVNFPAKNNIYILLQVRKIIAYVRKNNIELIHCHLPWAGFVGRFVHRVTGLPTVYTEHNIQDRYHFITRLINKITFNWQTTVVAVSNDVANSIHNKIKPKIPIITILNGVNTDFYIRNQLLRMSKRKELGIAENDILVGTIAVFRFQKRLKEWIDVLKIVTQKFPNVKGCIVGDGLLKTEIMNHLKSHQMEDKIFFPGVQTDVMPWLSAMDIFMMTSSFEGLPIALLEAMSMECAIAVTNAGGIKDVIRDRKDGFLKDVDQWKELAESIENLVVHPDQIKFYGNNARNRVIENFSMSAMVNQIEAFYFDILKKNKN